MAHPVCASRLTRDEHQALTSAAQFSGIGLGAIPAPLMADLMEPVELAKTAIERDLDAPAPR